MGSEERRQGGRGPGIRPLTPHSAFLLTPLLLTPHCAMISAVIPVFNERESLVPLHAEIVETAKSAGLDLEVVFVDDGSSDGSWDVIAELARTHPNVRGVRFRRNFGKAAALVAGFDAARGDVIFTLDADLQDDPHEIPRFLEAMQTGKPVDGRPAGAGLDVVSGWKRVRHDPWHKVFPSRVFNGMVGAADRRPPARPQLRHEMLPGRNLPRGAPLRRAAPLHPRPGGGAASASARSRSTIGRARFGHSKYGVRRFVKGFLDLLTVKFLTGFGRRPQHLLGGVGLVCFLLGGLGLAYLGVTWVMRFWHPDLFPPLHERPMLIYALGRPAPRSAMMTIGFLAELVIAYHGRHDDVYSVAERTFPGERDEAERGDGPHAMNPPTPDPTAAAPAADLLAA